MSQEDKAEKKIKAGGKNIIDREKKTRSARKGKKKAKEVTAGARCSLDKAVVNGALKSEAPPLVSEGIEPLDTARCQAEKPNGYTFMTLGGIPGLERCRNKPEVVVTETQPAKDGKIGHMTLCDGCLTVFKKTRENWRTGYVITEISLAEAQKRWDSLDKETRRIFENHGLKRPA